MQICVDKPLEAWGEVQRHSHDFAEKLAQGFTGLIQSRVNPPNFSWPEPPKLFHVKISSQKFGINDFSIITDNPGVDISAIIDIGNRLGKAGLDFGDSLNGLVQHIFRLLPFHGGDKPFRRDMFGQCDPIAAALHGDWISFAEQFRYFGSMKNVPVSHEVVDEEISGFDFKSIAQPRRSEGTINVTSTYDSRTNSLESSLAARGDLWRVEATRGSSTSGNENSSISLIQLGPVLFFRDTKLLLPVHLSNKHVLWYGYDRKNGLHSLCPAVWTKHRRWLLMSMICLNSLACSFVDFQFPNGQVTYVSGEGITTSAFIPVGGGLFQAEGQYPGEMRFSFSCQNKWGTQITPMLKCPDKSFTLGIDQALGWQRSGVMMRPTLKISINPTFGGRNSGLRAEIIHSVKEQLNLICGCAFMAYPTAFASISVGRSKWNGTVGSSGIVMRLETPMFNVGRPSFSIQLNAGIEF